MRRHYNIYYGIYIYIYTYIYIYIYISEWKQRHSGMNCDEQNSDTDTHINWFNDYTTHPYTTTLRTLLQTLLQQAIAISAACAFDAHTPHVCNTWYKYIHTEREREREREMRNTDRIRDSVYIILYIYIFVSELL